MAFIRYLLIRMKTPQKLRSWKGIVCNHLYCWYNWYYLKSKITQKLVLCKVKDFSTQALMSLWFRGQPYLKALSQSLLVMPNLWGPLQVTLKRTKSLWCKTRDCPSLIKEAHQTFCWFWSLTMITSNTTSSWVQTCYPRLDSSQTAQKETWNGLISPSHFVHLEVWIRTNSIPWETCFTSKPKTRSLVKIDSKALRQRFWMPGIKRQM